MKKSVSTMLLVVLICSAYFPLFAQSKRIRQAAPADPDYPTAIAQYDNIKAFSDGEGVFIRWVTKTELNNVGFWIYRKGENGDELVAPLVPGSYTKGANRTFSDQYYELYDPLGSLSSIYSIRTQFVYGDQSSTTFFPKFTSDLQGETGHTKTELENMALSKTGNLRKDSLALPSGLQTVVDQSMPRPDPVMQHRIMTQQGVKIDVKKDGMYKVTRAELQNAGFDVAGDPANWRLFVSGNEQAINVEASGQYIEFYGKGIDVRETDTRTYFLIADSVAGKRITSKFLGNIGGNVISNNYRFGVENKERSNYNPELKNGDVENWWGRIVISDFLACTASVPCLSVNVKGNDPAGPNAVVTLKLQGLPRSNIQHSIRARINDQDIVGTVTGTNDNNFSGQLSIPANLLIEGNNTLKIATATSADAIFFDSARIEYSRKYLADQNRLLFFTPGYRKIDVTGFTSSSIRVFDTTLDGNPQLITNLPITQNAGTFSVRMPSNRPAVMYAVEDSGLLQVASVTPLTPSSLGTPANVADMIIISYSATDFMAAAETWANYRRSSAGGSLTTKVIDVADIYDEFSYGEHSAMGIYRFLEYAKNNWQTPRPRYILLMGDASTDPRNYYGLGYNDLVPSMHVGLIYEDTGSDEALADFNHDGVAELAIGRIPARSASIINIAFGKTALFETSANQSLDRGAVCAFDRPDGYDFEAMCHSLMDQLPSGMPKIYVNRMLPPDNTTPDPNAHATLMSALSAGPYIANYSGHGSAGTWANQNFFSSNDAPLLTNTTRPSIYTMLTCFNGNFVWYLNDSLGEALLKAPGGAAATWASTTETTPDYQLTMGVRFYSQVGAGNITRMGDLVMDAKTTIAGSDVGYSWALLGDPALKVRQ